MTRHPSDRQAAETGLQASHDSYGPVHPDLRGAERDRPDLRAIEAAVRARWADIADRGRAVESAAAAPEWTCWAEPQAAVGLPGLHDVPAQVLADVYRRLKTMQGFAARGGSGISSHGIAVEVPVERELGLQGRADIEAYGLPRFNARCREFAARHGAAISDLNLLLGCLEAGSPVATMDQGFVETIWWSLGRLFEAGLVGRYERITPYCPRCQTPLSAQDLSHPGSRAAAANTAVIVRFRLASLPDGANPRLRGADLLAWTTRPWTLAGNVAIAVHPHQTYALARRAGHDDGVIVAEARLAPMLGEDWHVAARFSGADLAGATYHPVLNARRDTLSHPVIAGYFVRTHTGTGLMPLAPAYGPDDLDAARLHGLAAPDPLGTDGRFAAEVPVIGGAFFADANRILIDALTDAGALLPPARQADGEQACRRCGSPLLPRTTSAWYLRSSASWPDDDSDWMISRARYWGTPLPFWECPDGHVTCAESLAQLSELASMDLTGMDPHRPQIDEVQIACPQCAGRASRVPQVLDARYDAGLLPLSRQLRPAATASSVEDTSHSGIIIGIAGHSGAWPGTVRQIGAMVNGSPPAYRVLALEPVVDSNGQVMSRGFGNVVEPLPLIERHGSDVVRWFCVAAGQAEQGMQLSEAALEDIGGGVLAPYWGFATTLLTWLAAAGADADRVGMGDTDRWLMGELQAVIDDVTAGFDNLKPAAAAARIAEFIDLLVAECAGEGREATAGTLQHCLNILTRLMAPIAPFVTDEVWSKLLQCGALPGEPASVHLATWPRGSPAPVGDMQDSDS